MLSKSAFKHLIKECIVEVLLESVEYPIECPKCHQRRTIIDNPSTPIVYKCNGCGYRWNPDKNKPPKIDVRQQMADLDASNKAMDKMGLGGVDEKVLEEGPGAINKLSAGERNKISKAFAKVGLDGNSRFEKKEQGLQAITSALQPLGFQLDMVSGDMIMGDKGSRNFLFRLINIPGQDPFTEPPEISNSRIIFTWENLGQPGQPARFEILAYAS